MDEPLPDHVVVVADIVGSTSLYENLGDSEAKRLITDCLKRLSAIVTQHGGRIGATVGDALIATFPAPGPAAAAACEMQVGVQQEMNAGRLESRSLQLRIGMHGGPVAVDPLEMVSEVVAIARQVADLAKAEQTLLTADLRERLPGVYRAMTRFVDREPWRGATTRTLELHELVWEVEGLTAHAPALAQPTGIARVRLEIGGKTLVLDEARPVITAGRAPELNDLAVDCDLASREHFKLTLRNGRVTLTDTSTNGTYVVVGDAPPVTVLRESWPLKGSGYLYFGPPDDDNERFAVRFTCE